MVREVFARHAGERLTVGRGRGLADRLAQARALTAVGQSRGEAVTKIMAGLGVSRATAFSLKFFA